MSQAQTEKLFSYGTLRYEKVQIANFGRKLEGQEDTLQGFKLSMVEIKNTDVVATSGDNCHPIISYTGNPSDTIQGTVFTISKEELAQTDEYEVSEYKRVNVKLNSGVNAWVYINTQDLYGNNQTKG
ncbi:gamma-glutamylcyclotransferase [Legionella sp. PATHC032]|uniref:gamma-glutamylcyclotransferase family protein n=1 Tax=Legionella sp. PATHC032 TaxID=2992039 RepID=UPI001B157233|nr:gamma-glutamylcyclotransferase family protein [Legionella sp. PATHC032]MCW8421377.1 gamma-glutamylcyclotransferase [Legionella sp. PATHC032]HAZ7574611.1 gamma-glutamylcyclotransferase [Legionella pneumophila]HBA1634040.1 gamma-glutamylcyclotransferase [Legionella pneumophila]HBA1636712.1 gamma-glutamylcyclotransferase [Legionella pneumophila]